jgi:hypothetical protein
MNRLLLLAACLSCATLAAAQTPRPLMPINLANSAEAAWLKKPVLSSRVLDDMTQSSTWKFSGTGKISFPAETRQNGMRV